MTEYVYTTPQKVEEELRATAQFSSTTYPSLQTVTRWIQEESDNINNRSARKWGLTEYAETIDYDGEEIITLKNAPVVSVTRVVYSPYSLGTTSYDLSDTKTEDTDYAVYGEEGEVVILPSWNPGVGRKKIRVDYTAGYTDIPGRIQMLATKKVTKRVLDTLLSKDVNEKQSGKSVSVGSISIVKPADFGVSQYRTLSDDIQALEVGLLDGVTAYRIGGHRY